MKVLVFTAFTIFSVPIYAAPSWVDGLRSGEERMRVTNGSSILYRRLGETCERATRLIEEDIEREHGKVIGYKMEHIFEDKEHNDCAVTASIEDKEQPERIAVGVKALLREKAIKAKQNAYVGLSHDEFKTLTNDYSPMLYTGKGGLCDKSFEAVHATLHGHIAICWVQGVIAGFCDLVTDKCGAKAP